MLQEAIASPGASFRIVRTPQKKTHFCNPLVPDANTLMWKLCLSQYER